ncbi:MAG: tRNA-intron lyase [Thaumarchaeota archaeon]|nr:tRNA-intron lyase [Nitrososphaerota archaeon]
MEEEVTQLYTGELFKKGITVSGLTVDNELEKKGYGERIQGELMLGDFEALFLVYTGKLKVLRKGKEVSFNELVEQALKRDKDAWTKFLVYRDLRSRGYVAKDGFGFGVDFRVYERGEFGQKPAKYVIFGLNEGTETSVGQLRETVDQITRMGKAPIIAVVERRGEVIYYRVSRTRFLGPS